MLRFSLLRLVSSVAPLNLGLLMLSSEKRFLSINLYLPVLLNRTVLMQSLERLFLRLIVALETNP